ncbi:MAG TPA: sigma-70 family RNA polymerase sigma factor [Candidatus Angelobacter sp.]|nr:sigma-70 family RNA polymerase sigma factor [Candidatus Angelobacter sp.]
MKSSEIYKPETANFPPGAAQAALLDEPAVDSCTCNDGVEAIEDEWLVQGCLQRDQRAWEELIDKYKRLIFSIPIKYGASPDDAADVFQAVCIEVLNSLPQLKSAQSLRSWLITVTIRQSYRWKKRQANHVELDAMERDAAEGIASTTYADTLAQLEQEQIVREVVSQLTPRHRELVRLLFFEQPALPYAEVARRLGLATGSIGFIRGRCLEKLRKALLEHGFNG